MADRRSSTECKREIMRMDIHTRDYGKIHIDESSIIGFDEGIIGFENFRDYVLLAIGDESSPFKCLQSVEDSGVAFILFDPYIVRPDYEVEIDDDAAARLSIGSGEDVVIFTIAVVSDDIKSMSFNLKAPILINAKVNRGAQYIVDNADYGVRHFIRDELERAKRINQGEGKTAV
jgi:flagellar assembly factor FliW